MVSSNLFSYRSCIGEVIPIVGVDFLARQDSQNASQFPKVHFVFFVRLRLKKINDHMLIVFTCDGNPQANVFTKTRWPHMRMCKIPFNGKTSSIFAVLFCAIL